jgi:ParB family chromosome partitioning protein
VLVNGERRFRSGVHVGLETLDFVVRDDLAPSREEFVSNLLKENFDREDFDVIERARGVQEMVSVCGGDSERGARSRAATRLSRDRSWVTNQLALLSLPDEVQAMLSSGEVSERDGRLLARHYKEHPQLDAAGLLAHLKQTRAEEAREREEERSLLEAVKQRKSTTLLSADNKQTPAQRSPSPGRDAGSLLSADNKQPGGPADPVRVEPTSTVLLSADNNTDSPVERVPSQQASADTTAAASAVGNGRYPSTQPEAYATVQQLGSTSAQRARNLAAGMRPEDLKSLVEDLRAYL